MDGFSNTFGGGVRRTANITGNERVPWWDEDVKDRGTSYLDELFIAMKGYKEYTFAIRQSLTNAPTISVIRDDFKLDSPLVFVYAGVGYYTCNISSLGLSIDNVNNVCISNQNSGFLPSSDGEKHTYGYLDVTNDNFVVFTTKGDTSTRTNSVLSALAGVEISIREAL